MVSLVDKIKALLGMGATTEAKIEPVAIQPAELQVVAELPNNTVYHDFLRGAPEPQTETQTADIQEPGPNHAGELELLKHYAELAKQNTLDSDALNEDLE